MKNPSMASTPKGYRRIIPSMTALLQFESVARLNSFTLAAAELGVSQAAVSKQIRILEEAVGIQLFQRLHRSIALTATGEQLFAVISGSLQNIASGFDQISQGNERKEIVLASTAPVSQLRIMPRLHRLEEALPHVRLRLTTQMFTGDLKTRDFDMDIRFGHGQWTDGESLLLFEEEVFPVCSPTWLERNPLPGSLAELACSGLLESDATSEGWMTWSVWFKELQASFARLDIRLRCTLYTDVINAAVNGYGIALGWGRLVDHLIYSGQLVKIEPFVVRQKQAYYAVVPKGREVDQDVKAIVHWLQGSTVQ